MFDQVSAPFVVYNASAGSGKTYTLVKSYLLNALASKQPDYYKNILAITFTNKAVAEMKQRILNLLEAFAKGNFEGQADSMANDIEATLEIDRSELQERSIILLKNLLNNYALFSVETIDHFNHRLLRTFARDLKLNSNFEVSLDVPLLLAEAVDLLIDKAGLDEEITEWLVAYALQKTDEDKSWDITRDLNNSAKLLTKENDLVPLEKLRNKSLSEFKKLKIKGFQKRDALASEIIAVAQNTLSLIHSKGLSVEHFSSGFAYKFFKSISEGNLDFRLDLQWQNKIIPEGLYKASFKGTPEGAAIDAIVPQIAAAVESLKVLKPEYLLLKNILKNLIPLATIHLVDQELQGLKSYYNVLPISEFNYLIHQEIKDQPAPYLYERLGDRYRHFFIDEFQDTSLLQWGNLQPLIGNSLSQQPGSAMLVGDAKQSIYRWRGGLPEQFIELCNKKNPFPFVPMAVKNLGINFRSCKAVVEFNNAFFQFMAGHFGDENHKNLYTWGNNQEIHHDCPGYVQMLFTEAANQEDMYEEHSEAVLEQVAALLERNFYPGDICVLTRKNKEGIAVSEALAKAGYKVVSDETLLLKNAAKIQVLINLLQVCLFPNQDEQKVQILESLAKEKGRDDLFLLYKKQVGGSLKDFTESLSEMAISMDLYYAQSLGVFETMEYFIHCLNWDQSEDAFLTFFMDWVYQFSQNPKNSKWELMENWELKKDELSASAPYSQEAIRVMTIHKSKGLEFPVVIFPFANLDIYDDKFATTWYPWNDDGFEELLISCTKEVATYGEVGEKMYSEYEQKLELDNINLLYVALTRAAQELYIIGKDEKTADKPRKYSQFFKAYLQHRGELEEGKQLYSFGSQSIPIREKEESVLNMPITYSAILPKERGLQVVMQNRWQRDADLEEARAFGNAFHDLMAMIKESTDLSKAMNVLGETIPLTDDFIKQAFEAAQSIFNHEMLQFLFNGEDTVYMERNIITSQGIERPDRINIHPDGSVTILDYKTGSVDSKHEIQIKRYAQVMEAMGYKVINLFVVYTNTHGIMVNKL